jgi:hypothetical protein
VREALAAWRTHFLAHLAIERVRFFEQLTGLDERTLAESPVFDDWTAKDLLAHVAAWDELFTERMRLVLAGRQGEIASVEPDERNPAIHAERRDWTLDQAVRACEQARAAALEVMAQASDEELHRQRQFPWGGASLRLWMQWRAEHDANHAADLARWRQGGQPQGIAPTNERQDNLSASTPTRTTTLRTPPNHRAASRQAAPDP